MATTMRKLSRLATTARAAASFSASATSRRAIDFETTLYGSRCSTYSNAHHSHCFSTLDKAIGGNISYSSIASAARELHEKDLPHSNTNYAPKDVVLYQYQACPFCNKVKAFLEYHDIPYKIVEVNPINKKEIKWSDYKKVPILMVDGEQMVDSTDIIDKMFQRMHPDSVSEDEETQKWRGWVDNHLVHVLSPNIYRSPSEALESFDYITNHGNFSFTERLVAKYAGAAAMYFVSKKLKKRHNISDERKALYEASEAWVDALNGRQYLGGLEPNLGDLAVFGVLRPIRYLKSGKDMVENTRIGEWFTRMENEMKPHRDTSFQEA
ncbi:uncharacterized protein LOC111917453 [Lactuca sativa]|uniref:Prostaglandin E synthase 2 n=1 Tax=Lactuca sativa TaxID=4236 RepID=A0A9R1WBK9_LACSA|nr:uncharacterized protein LOC111917453 [Lactuca sativa]KAJ0220918.1 hypothetical protein LSAT_V11C200053960 [Lactuca sativa]